MDLTLLRAKDIIFVYDSYSKARKNVKKAMKKAQAPSVPVLNRNRTFIVEKDVIDAQTIPLQNLARTETLVPDKDHCQKDVNSKSDVIDSNNPHISANVKDAKTTVTKSEELKKQPKDCLGHQPFYKSKLNELPERHYSAPNIRVRKDLGSDYEDDYVYEGYYGGLRSDDIGKLQNCMNLICNALDQNKGDIEFADIEIIQCADVLQYNNPPFDQREWLYSLQNNLHKVRITEIDSETNSDEANKTKSNTSSSGTDRDSYDNNNNNSNMTASYIRVPTPSPMYVPKLNLDTTQTLPTVIEIAEVKSSFDSINSSMKSKTSPVIQNNWMKQGKGQVEATLNRDKSTNVVTWLSRSLGGDTRLKSASSYVTFSTVQELECKEETEDKATKSKQSSHSQTDCVDDELRSYDSHGNQKRIINSKATQTVNWNNDIAISASSEEFLFDSTRVNNYKSSRGSRNNNITKIIHTWGNEFDDCIEEQEAPGIERTIFSVNQNRSRIMSAFSNDSLQSCPRKNEPKQKSLWSSFVRCFICK